MRDGEQAGVETGPGVDGPVGVGWQITGTSSIERCHRIYALDGYTAPIDNTIDDLLFIPLVAAGADFVDQEGSRRVAEHLGLLQFLVDLLKVGVSGLPYPSTQPPLSLTAVRLLPMVIGVLAQVFDEMVERLSDNISELLLPWLYAMTICLSA